MNYIYIYRERERERESCTLPTDYQCSSHGSENDNRCHISGLDVRPFFYGVGGPRIQMRKWVKMITNLTKSRTLIRKEVHEVKKKNSKYLVLIGYYFMKLIAIDCK